MQKIFLKQLDLDVDDYDEDEDDYPQYVVTELVNLTQPKIGKQVTEIFVKKLMKSAQESGCKLTIHIK